MEYRNKPTKGPTLVLFDNVNILSFPYALSPIGAARAPIRPDGPMAMPYLDISSTVARPSTIMGRS